MSKAPHHDAPITDLKADKLGRSGFAHRIASSLIADARTKESTVIALCAEWGDGKTSTKNLIRCAADELANQSSKAAPTWVEFSPWQVSGLPSIESLFFEEVGIAIGKAPGKGSSEERVRRWRQLSAGLQAVGSLAQNLAPFAELAVPGAGFFGKTASAGAKKMSDLASKGADAAELSQKQISSADLKMKLRQSMAKLDSQIIVVIDDIDRLGDEEILLVLRLIKANADFPNLTYMLLFQRDVVERAVHRRTGESGRVYLEKFVQVFLDLPKVSLDKVRGVVTTGLTDIVNAQQISWERFEMERWHNVWIPGMSPFFRTLRDAYRYLNVVEFRLAGLVTRGVPEVNQLDIFAMECLRLFEPDVYRQVVAAKTLFMSEARHSERGEIQKSLDRIIEAAHVDHQKATRDLLKAVFPAVAGAYSNTSYADSMYQAWATQARICADPFFDRLFAGEVTPDAVSEADIADLVAAQDDRRKCTRLLKKHLANTTTSGHLLERLAMEKCFEKPSAKLGLRLALWDLADLFPRDRPSMDAFGGGSTLLILYWTLSKALLQMDDSTTKQKLVLDTLLESKGVSAFAWVADGYEERHQKNYVWPAPTTDELSQIKDELNSRLQRAADSESMLDSPHATFLVWTWLRCNPEAAQAQVKSWLSQGSKSVVLRLLRFFVARGTSWGMESYYVKKRAQISWVELEMFVPFNLWVKSVIRTTGKQTSKSTPEELKLFWDSAKRHASGKKDSSGSKMDEEDK